MLCCVVLGCIVVVVVCVDVESVMSGVFDGGVEVQGEETLYDGGGVCLFRLGFVLHYNIFVNLRTCHESLSLEI